MAKTLNENIQLSSFASQLHEQFAALKRDTLLFSFRQRAWEQFLKLGLPEKKQEAFRYLPLSTLYRETFVPSSIAQESLSTPIVYPECRSSSLVFVNGAFSPALSDLKGLPSSVVVLPLTNALSTYGAFLQNRWTKALMEERDPFTLINLALHREGSFIFIPPGIKIDQPIQIIHLIGGGEKEKVQTFSRLHVFVGAQSTVEFVSTTAPLTEEAFCSNHVLDIALDVGATCHSFNLLHELETGWHFDALRASLKRDSRLHSTSSTRGGKIVRQDYRVSLTGENAEARLHGVWMLEKNRQSHTHILMEHQAPHCGSMQLFKGVLDDVSQSSFEGKILVRKEAQKTNAYQLNHNLLLGDHALANSKPNLEIFADDVKASHGATVSQVKPEELFYLKSRGLSSEEAKRLLVEGFCKEVMEHFHLESVRENMHRALREFLYASP